MKKVFVVLALVGLMAGAAFGLPNYKMEIRDAATGLDTVDLPAGGTVTVQVWIDNEGDTTGGVAYGGAQGALLADKPGVSYAPFAADAGSTMITNYVSPWTQDASSTAVWKGWFQADPGDPAMPYQDWDGDGSMVALPGGPLPTPSFGSSRGASKGDSAFVTITLNVAPLTNGPITVSLDPTPGIGSLLFSGTGAEIPLGGYGAFTILPEPVSALLLLAGLPMLRRRR